MSDIPTKGSVKELFEKERRAAAQFFDDSRRSQYLSLKLEGIMEAPVNLCVTCDPTRGEEVLGRNSMPETDVYSTCCAVQNLWLAARSEGVGVGWVSILKLPQLRRILGIPPHVILVAYLCLGYPVEFAPKPLLQSTGWRDRLSLADLVHYDGCGRAGCIRRLGRSPRRTGSTMRFRSWRTGIQGAQFGTAKHFAAKTRLWVTGGVNHGARVWGCAYNLSCYGLSGPGLSH